MNHRHRRPAGIFCVAALMAGILPAAAQDTAALPPIAVYQAMLDANRQSGWVQFRNYDGHQWVYFTALQTMHCRLSQIRYSINSEALDERFPLVACNPQNPFALPPDAGVGDIALRLPAGTAQSVAVQVVWDDGRESEIARYQPCSNVAEQSCASPLQ